MQVGRARGFIPCDETRDLCDIAIIGLVEIIADTLREIGVDILLAEWALWRAFYEIADALLYPVTVAKTVD